MTVDEAAEQVRIRRAYVTAIEDDRFDTLPGKAYALGFVRAYAEFLGADADAAARVASADLARIEEPQLRARRPEVERESRFAPFAAVAICLALAGYVYWYFENARTRFEDAAVTLARVDAPNFVETGEPTGGDAVVSGPYRPFPDAVAPTTRSEPQTTIAAAAPPRPVGSPLPPSRQDPTRARYVPAAAPPAQSVAQHPLPPRDALAASLPAPRLAPAPSPRWPIPAPGAAVAANVDSLPAGAAVAATTQTVRPAPAPGKVMLHAAADTWIEIKSVKTGAVLFSRVLREGETLPAPDRTGLTMTVGNAGGLEISVDGVAAPSLGGHGVVRRDVSLDGPHLLAGH